MARSTRQVNLTENGTAYYHQSKELVIGLQQANEQVNQQQLQLNGTLRVSAAGGFAEHFVAPALMAFAQHHPQLTVEIDFNSKMVNFVEDEVDFAVRYGELADSSLIARKLISRPMMAAASPEYLEQNGTPTHPNHLKNHSCIISNNDHWLFNIDGNQKSIRVRGRWRSNNANVVAKACEQGLGVAYMPESTFKESLKNNRLVPILKPYWGKGASSWIVYKNRHFQPLRARLAIDFLIKHFASRRDI